MARTIDIKALIDERPVSPFQWVVVALCFVIVAADGMDVAIMGFVTPSILSEWSISRAAFGIVMSAAPLGLVFGALLAGPSSDRFGRKTVLTIAVFILSLFTLIAAFAASPVEMAIFRFFAGVGMGAAMPNSTTLLAEYAPFRRRALLITIMFTGFNLGSALIGFVAGSLIPHFGWRSVLIFGGLVPLALVPFLVWLLPESARLLALRGAPSAQIAKILRRVTGAAFTGDENFISTEPPLPTQRPIGILFSNGYGLVTVGLWTTYFMGLLVIYLLTGWLPTMMKDAGMPISTAANVTAMFQIGGTIGAVLVGWAMDRGRPAPIIALAYFIGGASILAMTAAGVLSPSLALIVAVAGFCMSGAQTGLNAFAPSLYPTVARATGVSWMQGIGRFGSIVGSAFGGALLGLGWGFSSILSLLAIPAILAAIAISLVGARSNAEAGPAPSTAHSH